MNVIVPKLECVGGVLDGDAKLVKGLETVQMTAVEEISMLENVE